MKIRIKNFRSLKDTGDIEIKPITILVGRNSSGKSSFLRTFPMLKQSTEEKTKSPILLYGNYVDFGSYKDIKPTFNLSNDENYELSFTLGSTIFPLLNKNYRSIFLSKSKFSPENFNELKYSLKFNENHKQLIQILEVNIEYKKNIIKIELDQNEKIVLNFSVNKTRIYSLKDKINYFEKGDFELDLFKITPSNDIYDKQDLITLTRNKIKRIIQRLTESNSKNDLFEQILEEIDASEENSFLNSLKTETSTEFRKQIESWDTENRDFIKIRSYILFCDFLSIIGPAINIYLKNVFSNIKYIAPLRATAERYYRIQQLAVDDVDPNGKNLPVFLDSLNEYNMGRFQEWTSENFGFKVKITKIEGHYSIKILHENSPEINLSDMGFGYSQILPILTQIWYSSLGIDRRATTPSLRQIPKIIVIEQPELHLHPEFQAKFAEAIAKVITSSKNKKHNLNIIIETHSDIIINKLGDCILSKQIDHRYINIVVFNKKSEKSPTDISTSYYDEDGNLNNWPLGFFSPTI